MTNKLHKVNVEVDVYVMAGGLAEAAKIALAHAGQEIAEFGLAHASEVENVYKLPEDWKKIVPYSKGNSEKRTCKAIMLDVKTKKESKPVITAQPSPEEPPEPVPEPVLEDLPVALPKEDTDLPQLRFKI